MLLPQNGSGMNSRVGDGLEIPSKQEQSRDCQGACGLWPSGNWWCLWGRAVLWIQKKGDMGQKPKPHSTHPHLPDFAESRWLEDWSWYYAHGAVKPGAIGSFTSIQICSPGGPLGAMSCWVFLQAEMSIQWFPSRHSNRHLLNNYCPFIAHSSFLPKSGKIYLPARQRPFTEPCALAPSFTSLSQPQPHIAMLGVKPVSLWCRVNSTLCIAPELTHLAWALIK